MSNTTLTLAGSLKIKPDATLDDVSYNPVTLADIFEQMVVALHHEDEYDLTTDGAHVVSLGGLASASVVVIKPDGKVTVTLTNADNVAQLVTTDQLLIIMCQGTPYTAVSLTRAAGIETNVRIGFAQLGT